MWGQHKQLESAFGTDSTSVWDSAGQIAQCFHDDCLTCVSKITGALYQRWSKFQIKMQMKVNAVPVLSNCC